MVSQLSHASTELGGARYMRLQRKCDDTNFVLRQETLALNQCISLQLQLNENNSEEWIVFKIASVRNTSDHFEKANEEINIYQTNEI